jgi:hypothetical protein
MAVSPIKFMARKKRTAPYTTLPEETPREIQYTHEQPAYRFKTLAERVARHPLFYKGWLCREMQKVEPFKHNMWHVDKCFPYAFDYQKKGPLLIDEPKRESEVNECLAKKEKLKDIQRYRQRR